MKQNDIGNINNKAYIALKAEGHVTMKQDFYY